MKIEDIYNSSEALAELLKEKLPIKIAFKLSKTKDDIDRVLKLSEEVRANIIKEYGEPNKDNPDLFDIVKEKIETANAEFAEHLQEEVDIDINTIPVESLPDTISISAEDVLKLNWLLV